MSYSLRDAEESDENGIMGLLGSKKPTSTCRPEIGVDIASNLFGNDIVHLNTVVILVYTHSGEQNK